MLRAMDILQILIQKILYLLASLFRDFIDAGTECVGLQHQICIGLLIVKPKIQHLTCERAEDQCKQGCDT